MKCKIAIIIITLCFFSFHASASNYIIIRTNVNPMYIEGDPIRIQVFILVFRNNKPTDETAEIIIKISGIGINYSYEEHVTIRGGRRYTISLPSLKEGHYYISIQAIKGNMKSQKIKVEFGVTKAPIPYSIHFSPDGSKLYFTSLKLNQTGVPDPDYPFTLYIYASSHGTGEVLIRTIKNVTKLTLSIPSSWRSGTLIVDVVDIYGWRNSATMDLSTFSFEGIPAMYDYEYMLKEPFKSRTLQRAATAFIILIILIILFIIFAGAYNVRRRSL